MAKSRNHRLQMDFSDNNLKDLEKLKHDCGHSDRGETIRQALRLLRWLKDQTKKGDKLLLQEEAGKQKEVSLVALGNFFS